MKLETYLGFIYDLAKSHIEFLHILTEKQVITRLMDLMCKYNSASLVYVQANPPLENLVLTVSFIVRSIPCLVDPLDLANVADSGDIDKRALALLMMEERGPSHFHKPLQQSFPLEKLTAE